MELDNMLMYNSYVPQKLCTLLKGVRRLKVCIRAHDLGVKGTGDILNRLEMLGIDGVQMVCYKAYDDISYAPGAITAEKAAAIGEAFRSRGAEIPLVGAYFNPVHPDREKARRCESIFAEYLGVCRDMGCEFVGSETGSRNGDPWIYHPESRTEESLDLVVETFSRLCDVAAEHGATVALEGAAAHVCWNVARLAEARRRIGKPTKVIFDLFNYLDAENQRDYLSILDEGLETFAGEILLFHMKDCRFSDVGNPKQVPFGTGDLDLEAILARIKKYDGNAVLTLEGTTGSDIIHAVNTIKSIWERV